MGRGGAPNTVCKLRGIGISEYSTLHRGKAQLHQLGSVLVNYQLAIF